MMGWSDTNFFFFKASNRQLSKLPCFVSVCLSVLYVAKFNAYTPL